MTSHRESIRKPKLKRDRIASVDYRCRLRDGVPSGRVLRACDADRGSRIEDNDDKKEGKEKRKRERGIRAKLARL